MRIGYPIKIRFKDEEYYTLYFDDTDELLMLNNTIVSFDELLEGVKFKYDVRGSIVNYDFDQIVYFNPIDYNEVLDKWNLLNTIAKMFSMYFEGDKKDKTFTYNYLFRCVFSTEELPEKYKLPNKCILDINKVFKKTERYMKKLVK